MAQLPLLIARERGYFERHGVEVDLRLLESDDDGVDLLDSGELDLLGLTGSRLLDVSSVGLDISGVLILGTSLESEAVLAGGQLSDVRQLRGRRVALVPGSAAELVLGAALGRKGLALNDVQIVPATAQAAIDQLIAGEVDAAASHAPWLPLDPAAGNLRTLTTAADQVGLVHDILAGDTEWLEAHRPQIMGLIQAWNDAIVYLRRSPGPTMDRLAETLELPVARLAAGLQGVELLDVAENMQFLRGTFQKQFADMGDVLNDNRDNRSISFSSANRVLLLSPLRQVAAGR